MSAPSPSIVRVPDEHRELKLVESALSHDLDGSARGLKSLAGILLQKHADLLDSIRKSGDLSDADAEKLKNAVNGYAKTFA